MVRARFFQRASDNVWLLRVDTESPLTLTDAELHCSAEYGFPVLVTEETLTDVALEAIKVTRRIGAVSPPATVKLLTPDEEAWNTATTQIDKLDLIAKKLGFKR